MMEKVTVTKDFEESFKELKAELVKKYTDILCGHIDVAKDKTQSMLSQKISPETISQYEEMKRLEKEVEKAKKEFFKQPDYVEVQNKLKAYKERLENCDESEKDEIQKQTAKLMSEIVTLNITIRNRLKDKTDLIASYKNLVDTKVKKINEEMSSIKDGVMSFLRLKIAECIADYNEELDELCQNFKKPKNGKEFPFSSEIIKIDVPIFSIFEEVSSVEKTEDEQNFIVSENTNKNKH